MKLLFQLKYNEVNKDGNSRKFSIEEMRLNEVCSNGKNAL